MRAVLTFFIAAVFGVASVSSGNAQDRTKTPVTFKAKSHNFKLIPVSGPLDQAWGMTFLPDGRILVTEKAGRIRIVAGNGKTSAPLNGVPKIEIVGQGGLMDIALHPKFADNRLVYFTHTAEVNGNYTTALSRGRLSDDETALENVERLFTANSASGEGRHFGSRILFGPDGKLFMTMGDRGARDENPQDLSRHPGSVFRLNDDGSVPPDNPFVNRKDAQPEIWSYGHRNPQGITYRPDTGDIWLHEHGPRGGDELNIVKKGANYGWPEVTFGINYWGTKITDETRRPGIEPPVVQWTPSIAPSGLAWYTGDKFPRWKNSFFVGALAFQLVERVPMKGDNPMRSERLLTDWDKRIRDVRVGPEGYIYLLVDETGAPIWRMEPAE